MKSIPLIHSICCIFVLSVTTSLSEERGFVGRVTSEVHYSYKQRSKLQPWKTLTLTEKSEPHKGACFLLKIGSEKYLVTAKHVVRGGSNGKMELLNGKKIDLSDSSIKRTARIRVGTFNSEPLQIAISSKFDLCVMKLSDQTFRLLNLTETYPDTYSSPGQTVSAWGYPGTAGAQIKNALSISEVLEDNGYLVISSPLDGGYSGGPILKSESKQTANSKKVLGVTVRSTDKQSRVILIKEVLELIKTAKWVEYKDKIGV